MMRAVLYTYDLQPITVIDVTRDALAYIEEHQRVALAVVPPLRFDARGAFPPSEDHRCYTVTITAERIRRGHHEAWMLFTHDEEHALVLRAAFLPGQVGAVRERERGAFAQGFVRALNLLGE